MQKYNKYSYVPFYVSLGVVLGILIGSFYANQYSQKFLSIIDGSGNKLSDLLYIIEDQYVDPVQMNEIVEKALPQILRELDPHSVYISAAESEQAMQNLNGSFSGIGIQFFHCTCYSWGSFRWFWTSGRRLYSCIRQEVAGREGYTVRYHHEISERGNG